MAKVFIAFCNAVAKDTPSSLPCFYETFIKGLSDAGNTIMVEITNIWTFPGIQCPLDIANKIKKFNPDICFLFNNCFYDISNIVECPIVIYEVDSFLYYQNKQVLYNNPNQFYYLVFQTHSIDVLQQELHVKKSRICHVPFFTEVHAKKEPLVNNICFVGSKFTNGDQESVIHNFMLLNPNNDDKLQLKKCLEIIVQNPYASVSDIEKTTGKLSDKVLTVINSSYIVPYLSDVRRIKGLTSVTQLGLSLHGPKNWLNDLAYDNLPLSYNPQYIFSLNDTEKLYNSHKIGININHIQATHGFGWRVADIMASNACLVSEFKPDFKTVFPDVEIPLFYSIDEAYDVCKKLLDNENMRLDIVAQCQEIINKRYRVQNALQTIEEFIGVKLSSKNHSNDGRVIFLPIIKQKQSHFSVRLKQITNSFGLFISSLPPFSLIGNGKLQTAFKKKVDKYIKITQD